MFITYNISIISFKTINDFIHGSFDIIMEADELDLDTKTEKITLCIPNNYDDPIFNECKKAIEQIIENKLWDDVSKHFMK